jgi:signal transduction histidine kinase
VVTSSAARPDLSWPQRRDFGLAFGVAVIALIDVAVDRPPEPVGIAVAAALATSLPLAWRSLAPTVAALVPIGALLLASVLGSSESQPTVTTFAPLIGLFALGEHGTPKALLWAGPACVLLSLSFGAVEGDAGATTFGFFLSVGTIAVGRAVRAMAFETDLLEAKVGTLEQEQERRTREAIADERARIARELHDVVGHSISLMGIQAGAVRRVLPPGLERERELLQTIERTGRDSVAEMRRLIELLRAAGEVPDSAPPTLALAGELVDEMRRAGLTVDLAVVGDLDGLPPGRGLAGYRVLQEALTNALKHAPGAPVSVRIRRSVAGIELEIESGPGPARRPPSATPGGHGLIGMHERVTFYDGELTAGPTPDGGFRVRAWLPEEES